MRWELGILEGGDRSKERKRIGKGIGIRGILGRGRLEEMEGRG